MKKKKLKLKSSHIDPNKISCKKFGHKFDDGICMYCGYNPQPLQEAKKKVLKAAEEWHQAHGKEDFPDPNNLTTKLFEAVTILVSVKKVMDA